MYAEVCSQAARSHVLTTCRELAESCVYVQKIAQKLLDIRLPRAKKKRFLCLCSDGANPRRNRKPNLSGHDTVLTGARCPSPKKNGVPARMRYLTFHVKQLPLTDFALDSCTIKFIGRSSSNLHAKVAESISALKALTKFVLRLPFFDKSKLRTVKRSSTATVTRPLSSRPARRSALHRACTKISGSFVIDQAPSSLLPCAANHSREIHVERVANFVGRFLGTQVR